jgi:hypothetical protein
LATAARRHLPAHHHLPDFADGHRRHRVVQLGAVPDVSTAWAVAEALRRAPDFREAHCNLAALYEQLGRRRDAIRHYATAKRLGALSKGVDE